MVQGLLGMGFFCVESGRKVLLSGVGVLEHSNLSALLSSVEKLSRAILGQTVGFLEGQKVPRLELSGVRSGGPGAQAVW